MEIPRRNKKKNTRDKKEENTVTEIKNAFDGLISRRNVTEERISEL